MLESVIDAKHIKDYQIWIAFDDGKEGKINLSKTLKNRGGVFKPLQSINYFKNFKIENDTLSWKNGADLAPESLYELLNKKPNLIQKVSQFLGIKILMNCKETKGEPHFYAEYSDCNNYKISVEIKTGIVKGKMPPRALELVLEWLNLHKKELLKNWQLANKGKSLNQIAPLE